MVDLSGIQPLIQTILQFRLTLELMFDKINEDFSITGFTGR